MRGVRPHQIACMQRLRGKKSGDTDRRAIKKRVSYNPNFPPRASQPWPQREPRKQPSSQAANSNGTLHPALSTHTAISLHVFDWARSTGVVGGMCDRHSIPPCHLTAVAHTATCTGPGPRRAEQSWAWVAHTVPTDALRNIGQRPLSTHAHLVLMVEARVGPSDELRRVKDEKQRRRRVLEPCFLCNLAIVSACTVAQRVPLRAHAAPFCLSALLRCTQPSVVPSSVKKLFVTLPLHIYLRTPRLAFLPPDLHPIIHPATTLVLPDHGGS